MTDTCACGHDKTVHVFGDAGCSACVLCDVHTPLGGPGSTESAEPPFDGVPAPGKPSERVTALCVLGHGTTAEGRTKVKQAAIGQLCAWHREELDTMLRETFELLATGPDYSSDAGDRSRTKKAHWPAPVDLAWMAIHDPRNSAAVQSGDIPDVRGELTDHLARADDEHGKRGNGDPFQSLPRHHDWLCEQDWLIDYRDCLRNCRNAARQVTRQPSILMPDAVTCPVTTDGSNCGGRMRRHERGLKCVKCGRLWESNDLLRLGLIIGTEQTA